MTPTAGQDQFSEGPLQGGAAMVRARPPQQPAEPGAGSLRRRSDEELARLGSSGMEELFRRHNAALHRFCRSLTKHADEASDAMQTVWERALVTFTERSGTVLNVRPWLYTVARNECLDRIRARGAFRTDDVTELDIAAGPTPEETHEQRTELAVLLRDVAGLSDRQRSALVLREFEGLTPEELGSRLGTSPNRALGLVTEARRGLIERRNGRAMACSVAQGDISRMRRRSTGVQAHLESCFDCQAFERRRRGRTLSSLAMTPLLLVRDALDHLSAIAQGKLIVATAVAAGAVGLTVVPFEAGHRPAPNQSATAVARAPAVVARASTRSASTRSAPRPQTTTPRHAATRTADAREPLTDGRTRSRPERSAAPSPSAQQPAAPAATDAPAQAPPASPQAPKPAVQVQAHVDVSLPAVDATVETVAAAVPAAVERVAALAEPAMTTARASVERVASILTQVPARR